MTYRRWTEEELAHCKDLDQDGLNHLRIAMELNDRFHVGETVRTASKVRDAIRKGRPAVTRERQEWGDDGSTVSVGNRAYSDEEMAEMFGVDMGLWHVTKRVTNVWGQNTQTKLWWAPNELEILTSNWDDFLGHISSDAIKLPGPNAQYDKGLLYQINIFDAHIGMKAWGPETGEDYDLYIALDRYRQAFSNLLAEAPQGARILLPIGQDLFHFDTLIQGKAGATAKGTPQDVDSRWQKLFIATTQMLANCIEAARARGPVDIIIVPGNHDTQTTFYAGQYLQALYSAQDDVRLDVTPRMRKYYAFGDVLLGFTHGHEEKKKDLFGLMAEEAGDDWSDSYWREWHRGHVHQEEVSEDGRLRIRTMPALSGTDSWHAEKGYRSMPGARAFLWHRTNGLVRQEYYNVPRREANSDNRGVVLSVS